MTTETLDSKKSDSITAPDMVAEKLPQTVEIRDVGPCKKHVKVTIEESAIKARFDEKFSDLVLKATGVVPGFRPGKAPRKIVEKRYKKEVAADIKQELLMASLEQLAEEQAISPLSPPELDPLSLNVPETGPFIYEFDIEVRPEFDLPSYKGLTIRRPQHTFTEQDVAKTAKRMLEPLGKVEAKTDPVAIDDLITADVAISREGKEINKLTDTRFKIEKRLALDDGVCENFGDKLSGAKVGDTRTVEITLSQAVGNPELKGAVVQAAFTVKEIKKIVLPEMNEVVFDAYGVRSADQFDELVRSRLDRQLEYQQRQTARAQVLEKLAKDANWELPQDMLQRQARRTLSRRVMEMRESGMTDAQIRGRSRVLENDAIKSTAAALKEHFVLQKIAEVEKIEIEDADIEAEIDAIAERTGESYRKVRARLEKDDLIEALATELLERKALDLVLESATYEDYEFNPIEDREGEVSTAEASAAPPAPPTPAEPAAPSNG
ncbi:MAG: trigger factor [Gemmataceae bacterium]